MYCENFKSYNKENIVDSTLEKTDPTPNLHDLFRQFNKRFFWDRLNMVEVTWSTSRMTSCAGVCTFRPRTRHCQIRISAPLMSLRSRKDLVETLLHEMIHAFLFMTNNNRDRDDHGPEFHKHMYRINKEAGTKITVYHTFHDEVKSFQNHVWRCNGPCQNLPPFYGIVRRANNRAPGPYDRWWAAHQKGCSGTYEKIKEPDGYSNKKKKPNGLQGPMNKFITATSTPKPKSNVHTFADIASRSGSFKKPIVPSKKKVEMPNVNNTVREIWAKKYPSPGKRKSEETAHTSKKLIIQCPDCDEMLPEDEMSMHKDKCEEKENPCPACGVLVKRNRLEDHLNSCLEDSINDDFFNLSGTGDQDESVACPICGKNFDAKLVNSHVDECIKNSCPICKAPIEKGRLEEHLNVCLEDSMTEEDFNERDDVTTLSEGFATPCSSNNDGERVRNQCTPCDTPVETGQLKEHLNISSVSNEINSEENISSERNRSITVACPICAKNVPENTINSHVDECLNLNALRDEFFV